MSLDDFLPREEPWKPLYKLPPGFVDELMEKIHAMERPRKARRNAVILAIAAGVCVIAFLAWAALHS